MGAAFTYYRIELTYEQNERQIYNSFRDEFLDLMRSKPYEFNILDIPDIWLFNSLYPNAKNGDHSLSSEFEEFLTYEDKLAHQGFNEAMNNLSEVINTKDQYYAHSHFPLGNMFLWLRDFMPLDGDMNLSFLGGAKFEGEYSKVVSSLSKDIFYIATTVNAFEGWRFFSNKSKRSWRKNIDRLDVIANECKWLTVFFDKANNASWVHTLTRRDFDKFKTLELNDVIHDSINHKSAKEFILESYTSNNLIQDTDAIELLKSKLGL